MRKIRNWVKCIIFECLREAVKDTPLIVSNRLPTPEDHYQKNTIWECPEGVYISTKVTIEWTKITCEDGYNNVDYGSCAKENKDA